MRVHLGSGPHVLDGWQNLDLLNYPGVISHDLTRPLPYMGGTVSMVFTEHFLEHLTEQDAINLLKECHRVMKPGAVMRIIVPDLAQHTSDYVSGNLKKYQVAGLPYTTNAHILNHFMRSWGHQYGYDLQDLHTKLVDAGFKTIVRQEKGVSIEAEMPIGCRPGLSELHVECIR